tara:strand:+ start:997 stop:2859 length:1863 start_codon:yes stop_codon:yes gene_type:complete
MANPLEAYEKVLTERGLGTPKTKLDAMIQSGELTDPLERFPVKKGSGVDDVQRFFMGLGNTLKAGGRSRLPGGAYSPYVVPKNIQEATEQVTDAGELKPDLTGAKFDDKGNLIGKTPDDFVPFDTNIFDAANTEILKNLKPGEEPPTKSIMGLMGASDEALAQLEVAENEAQRAKTQKEAMTALAQLNQEVAEGEMGRKKPSGAVIESAFSSAMQDYIEQARGAGPKTKEMSIDDYKKEFAEATGIDISGKVDKSSALMAFGLALMQNRAGKGFNVGRMLSAVGEAGEAALPALEKAKQTARANALAAGQYALQTRATDRATDAANQEKLMNRGKYWIYKKGGKGAEFSEFDNGEFVDLNKFELNELLNNPDFDKNYEFIDASDRLSILEKRAEGQDLGDMWESYERISLIGGKADEMPPELQVVAAVADSNYKGTTPTRYKLAEDPKTVARRFAQYQQDINSGTKKMQDLLSALDSGVTIPEQFLSKANEILVAFGIGETDDITDAKRELKNIAIDRATEILRESGKTLSDRDRDLVIERIGKISWGSADVDQIRKQLKDIYDLTILKPQRNLDTAIEWLEVNAGISFGAPEDDMPTQEELDAINKATGKNLTMDDFKK